MRRRRAGRQDGVPAPGQDSFLDIVANLVGILIILVIVVGIRAKDTLVAAATAAADSAAEVASESAPAEPPLLAIAAPDEPTPAEPLTAAEPEDELDSTPVDVESARRAAEGIETSVLEINEKLKRQELEINYRRQERDRIQLLIAAAQQKVEEEQAKLSQTRQQELARQRELAEAQQQVDLLKQQMVALETASPPVQRIDHLPTPMAKTVFGKELHFRLQGGRLAHVPWDELVEKLKEDAPNRVWKLKDAPRITETIGPLGGFRLRYTLKKTEQMVRTDAGAGMQQRVELDYFHIVPVDSNLGEPVARAVSDSGSQLQNLIGSSDPKSTTITVWVYPDSFEDFRTIKQWLFQRGFLTASRPMPEGRLMGGAPEGTRAASQ